MLCSVLMLMLMLMLDAGACNHLAHAASAFDELHFAATPAGAIGRFHWMLQAHM